MWLALRDFWLVASSPPRTSMLADPFPDLFEQSVTSALEFLAKFFQSFSDLATPLFHLLDKLLASFLKLLANLLPFFIGRLTPLLQQFLLLLNEFTTRFHGVPDHLTDFLRQRPVMPPTPASMESRVRLLALVVLIFLVLVSLLLSLFPMMTYRTCGWSDLIISLLLTLVVASAGRLLTWRLGGCILRLLGRWILHSFSSALIPFSTVRGQRSRT